MGGSVCRTLTSFGVEVVTADRARPIEALGPEVLRASRAIIWLANSIRPGTPDLSTRADEDIAALRRCLAVLDEAAASPQLLVASSGGTVYADEPPPYSEQSRTAGATPYAAAKLALEQELVDSGRQGTILRISNPYGPGQSGGDAQGVVAHWLRAAARGDELVMIGDADTVRDYIYVDDLADAIARAATSRQPLPPILNLGSGEPVSLGQLLECVEQTVAPLPVAVDKKPGRPFDRAQVWLDVALTKSTLSWDPLVTLEQGVARTWLTIDA